MPSVGTNADRATRGSGDPYPLLRGGVREEDHQRRRALEPGVINQVDGCGGASVLPLHRHQAIHQRPAHGLSGATPETCLSKVRNPAITEKHLMTPPPEMAVAGLGISPELEKVVHRALEKETEGHASVEEFIADLERAVVIATPVKSKAKGRTRSRTKGAGSKKQNTGAIESAK